MNFGLVKSFASIGVVTVVAIVISIKLYYKYKYINNKSTIVMESIPSLNDEQNLANVELVKSIESIDSDSDSDSASYVTVSEKPNTK